jgi:hypothetical protein
MSGNTQIKKRIESSQELLAKLQALDKQLTTDLKDQFQEALGVAVPTIIEADLLKLDMAMVYETEFNIDNFVTGAMSLANAAFGGDMAEVANKAVTVATTAIQAMVSNGKIQTGVKGSSAKIKKGRENYVAALYASTALCSSAQWFTQTDFFVSKYIFVVFPVVRPQALEAVARLREI